MISISVLMEQTSGGIFCTQKRGQVCVIFVPNFFSMCIYFFNDDVYENSFSIPEGGILLLCCLVILKFEFEIIY